MQIAQMFNKKDHVTIRSSLVKAEYVQNYEDYIEATRVLMEMIPFIIPPYKEYVRSPLIKKHSPQNLKVTVSLTKKQFYNYMHSQDINIIFDILWKQFSKSQRYAKR
jgi:hypothetical protein